MDWIKLGVEKTKNDGRLTRLYVCPNFSSRRIRNFPYPVILIDLCGNFWNAFVFQPVLSVRSKYSAWATSNYVPVLSPEKTTGLALRSEINPWWLI